jgi:hypothetical protein
VAKVNVQVKLAQEEYDRQAQLFEKKVVAQAALDVATRNIDAAKQGLAAAQAAAENARLAYESEIGGVRMRSWQNYVFLEGHGGGGGSEGAVVIRFALS